MAQTGGFLLLPIQEVCQILKIQQRYVTINKTCGSIWSLNTISESGGLLCGKSASHKEKDDRALLKLQRTI